MGCSLCHGKSSREGHRKHASLEHVSFLLSLLCSGRRIGFINIKARQ
jgi:hypothetical protein